MGQVLRASRIQQQELTFFSAELFCFFDLLFLISSHSSQHQLGVELCSLYPLNSDIEAITPSTLSVTVLKQGH